MSVYVTIPSARPIAEVEKWASLWKNQGYRIALWRDREEVAAADYCIVGDYPGWPTACNRLIADVLEMDAECDWCVVAGDDTWPDPNKRADEIAQECRDHFAHASGLCNHGTWAETFGVMQPTGDRWADAMGVIIERIAGSPWIGREYALRINGGNGPWWSEYYHSWADEECKLVAEKLGVYWMRPDLCHFHDHCMRYPGGKWAAHLQHVSADYQRMQPLFQRRKREGFPGHEPLSQIGAKA